MAIKLDQLTTAEAMSHPDVALTINKLGKMADGLRTQNQALLEALKKVLSESHDGPLHDDYRKQAHAAIKLAERDDLRSQNQALLKEMRYIAGVSTGQVKRVAEQALGGRLTCYAGGGEAC